MGGFLSDGLLSGGFCSGGFCPVSANTMVVSISVCDTSDNVCLDQHNCCYSISIYDYKLKTYQEFLFSVTSDILPTVHCTNHLLSI